MIKDTKQGEAMSYDVAIVGAGPVGVMLTALLSQAGLSVFIGDASSEVYPLPRAAVFDQEIMRLFQQLGIVDDIAQSIILPQRYIVRNHDGEELLAYDVQLPGDTGWASYMMHQPGIETALRGCSVAIRIANCGQGCAWTGPLRTTSKFVRSGMTTHIVRNRVALSGRL